MGINEYGRQVGKRDHAKIAYHERDGKIEPISLGSVCYSSMVTRYIVLESSDLSQMSLSQMRSMAREAQGSIDALARKAAGADYVSVHGNYDTFVPGPTSIEEVFPEKNGKVIRFEPADRTSASYAKPPYTLPSATVSVSVPSPHGADKPTRLKPAAVAV